MRRFVLLPIALLLALVAVSPSDAPHVAAQTLPEPGGPPGAERITDAQLRGYLTFLASDLLEGRATPSRGLDIAASFLAAHAARLGLAPAGADGSYLQPIALTRRRLDREGTTLTIGRRTFAFGDGFLPGDVTGVVEGALVYVGNGTVIRSRGLDPYRDVDVSGRIVISNAGLPVGFTAQDLEGRRGENWERTEEAARARGAVAVLFLPDYAALANWPSRRDSRARRTSLTVDAFGEEAGGASLPTATLAAPAVAALFAGQAIGAQEIMQRAVRREAAAPFALSGDVRARLSVATSDEHLTTANVVAVIEGSDPGSTREYVALGAHYDHLGEAPAANADGDRIYNGADDNGSGTVGLMAIAEALALTKPRPKRSVLVVWHTGEEQGLWGSRYFTQHPTVPLDKVVAHLNVDMIGRGRQAGQRASDGPLALTDMDGVYVVGSRRVSPALGDTLDRVNARYHDLRFDYSLDGPGDPERIYERSDHYHYARRGIPVAFFFTGIHEDYHGLDDEIDAIDFPKMRRIVQTIYAATRALADGAAGTRRQSDGPGPK